MRHSRPIQTRFRYGSIPEGLSRAAYRNSPVHNAKGTPSPVSRCKHRDIGLRQLCRYMVSGTFHTPSRGSFHLSLALLFTIGRDVVLSLGEWAPLLHTEFHGFRATLVRQP